MVENQYKPDTVSPPGDTLRECILAEGITLESLSLKTSIKETVIVGILEGRTPITEFVANRLAIKYGKSKRFWLIRERNYRKWLEEQG